MPGLSLQRLQSDGAYFPILIPGLAASTHNLYLAQRKMKMCLNGLPFLSTKSNCPLSHHMLVSGNWGGGREFLLLEWKNSSRGGDEQRQCIVLLWGVKQTVIIVDTFSG